MKAFTRVILPVLFASLWISASEFIRNEILVKKLWLDHFEALGIKFPSGTENAVIWVVWSLLFAIAILIISVQFNLIQTTLLAWLMGFIMMWISIGNLGVLPFDTLIYAIPLSILETFIASLIIIKMRPAPKNDI